MAVTTSSKTLRLTFTTALGTSHSISLKHPRADLTAAEAEATMDLIIAKNIFLTTGGAYVAKKDIKVLDNTTTDLYDVPIV